MMTKKLVMFDQRYILVVDPQSKWSSGELNSNIASQINTKFAP